MPRRDGYGCGLAGRRSPRAAGGCAWWPTRTRRSWVRLWTTRRCSGSWAARGRWARCGSGRHRVAARGLFLVTARHAAGHGAAAPVRADRRDRRCRTPSCRSTGGRVSAGAVGAVAALGLRGRPGAARSHRGSRRRTSGPGGAVRAPACGWWTGTRSSARRRRCTRCGPPRDQGSPLCQQLPASRRGPGTVNGTVA